jgi:phage gp46-like protein
MAMLRVRIDEGSEEQPILLWDSVWSPPQGMADWALAGPDEMQNRGGLRSRAALHTAIVLALFTDRRMPDDHPLRYLIDDGDARGWFGDGVDVRADLFETEMGSLLWIFERAELTEDIRRWVERLALEALDPLIAQGVAERIEAQAVAQFAVGRVDLTIQVYARDQRASIDFRFIDIWQQTVTAPLPPPFPQYPEIEPPESEGMLDFSDEDNSQYIPLI